MCADTAYQTRTAMAACSLPFVLSVYARNVGHAVDDFTPVLLEEPRLLDSGETVFLGLSL